MRICAPTPAIRQSPDVLVKVRDVRAASEITAAYQAREVRRFDVPAGMRAAFGGELLQVRLPDGAALAALRRDPRVLYAVPNDRVSVEKLPNDLDPRQFLHR